VREYQPGDDVRTIDWNVTARMGHPYIKKFVEERELTVFILVDVSASGDFGSAAQRKRELAAELAAVLAFNAIRNNDQVGLLLFSDRDELHLTARKGRGHVLRLIRELLVHERESPRTDIGAAIETMMRVNRRKAVIFIISDFLDEGYASAMTIANKRHDIIAMRILDPRERAIVPAGYLNIEDAETGEQLTFSTAKAANREAFANIANAEIDGVVDVMRRAKVDLIDIVNGEDYVQPLMQFFKARERRR
jgi:uncharacterized protein (DUF58 family)